MDHPLADLVAAGEAVAVVGGALGVPLAIHVSPHGQGEGGDGAGGAGEGVDAGGLPGRDDVVRLGLGGGPSRDDLESLRELRHITSVGKVLHSGAPGGSPLSAVGRAGITST